MPLPAEVPGVVRSTDHGHRLYYLGRSLAIAPAAFVGGLLWRAPPQLPFYVAGAIGLLGTLVFIRTVDAEHAG